MDYKTLVSYYEKIDSTSKRLEKVEFISDLIKNTSKSDIQKIIFLLQGKVFPKWDDQKIGIASKLIIKALCKSTGAATSKIEHEWKKTGDLGITAENLTKNKTQITLFSTILTLDKVFDNITKLASLEGNGSVDKKMQYITELLTSASGSEAKYIVRTLLEELRVGASAGTLRDSIIKAFFTEIYDNRDNDEETKIKFKKYTATVQRAYDLTNDYSEVVMTIIKKGFTGLNEITLKVGKPVNPMLFPKAANVEEGFDVVGKPAIIEYKYDGFRVQAHKNGNNVELYTRRLENVTHQFPDIVKNIKKYVKAEKCILDSEVLGIDKKTGRMLPFQNISQRIRRKYDIEEIMKTIPVVHVIFDIILLEDKALLETDFGTRRKLLQETIDVTDGQIELSKMIKTYSATEANKFYQDSLLAGNEGIMMKSLSKGYKPGARIGNAVKVKPVLEPLDLVITGAEWGKGKRTGWLTSFTVACTDFDGEFIEMGKVGTGIKELDLDENTTDETHVTFKQFTELLKPLILSESGQEITVKAEIIVEVDYEEIQASNNYSSGYALRFPRIKRIRTDLAKPCNIDDVKRIYNEQRGRGE